MSDSDDSTEESTEELVECEHCHGGKFRPHTHNVRSVR